MTQTDAQQLLSDHKKFIKTTTFIHNIRKFKRVIEEIKIIDDLNDVDEYRVMCNYKTENDDKLYTDDLGSFMILNSIVM